MNSLYTAEGVMDKHSLWQRYVPLVRHEALRLQVRLPASVELDDLPGRAALVLNAVERYDAYKERHLQLTQCSVSVALCWMNFAAVTGCRAACDATRVKWHRQWGNWSRNWPQRHGN